MMLRNLFALFAFSAVVSVPGAFAIPVSGQGSWETTLQGRDLDGNPSTFEAWFDTVLGVTWFGDADYARTAGVGSPEGRFSWGDSQSFIASLNSSGFQGFSDWRSPTTAPVNGSAFDESSSFDGSTDGGYNISALGSAFAGSTVNEMAHLFYNTLGNTAAFDVSGNATGCGGDCFVNTGPFFNFDIGDGYWTNVYVPTGNRAWAFNPNNGRQDLVGAPNANSTLIVRTGDVAPVPLPAPIWLFLFSLLSLSGFSRNKTR